MKKILILIMIVTSALLFSCDKNSTTPDTKKSTTDLVVPSSFDWKTSKNIEMYIVGESGVNNILNTFYIKSANGDTIYYNDVLNMNIDYTIKINVPTTETMLVIVYGAIEKELDLTSNTITFNYF